MLKINNLKKYYHTKKDEYLALDNITFSMDNHEFVAIVGPSGCGKSTILSIIAGVLEKSDGDIVKDCSLGYMLQNDLLFNWLSIFENCLLGLSVKGKICENDRNYVKMLLKKYGLIDFINMYPEQLSGGMRQRVALIRTLATKPDILLLDEPFSAIDSNTRIDVSNDIYKILKKENKGIILVTHDIEEAVSMCERILILSNSPSYICSEINTKISGLPIKRRENNQFFDIVKSVKKEIKTNVQ